MMKALKKKRKGGFTLIELIVVIAILGILAAIAIPRFAQVQTNAQDNANKATARTILSAVTMAEAKTQPAAPTVTDINSFLNEPIIVAAAATATNKWAVNKDANGKWIVYMWNGAASVPVTP